jgi:hypothetical protein
MSIMPAKIFRRCPSKRPGKFIAADETARHPNSRINPKMIASERSNIKKCRRNISSNVLAGLLEKDLIERLLY